MTEYGERVRVVVPAAERDSLEEWIRKNLAGPGEGPWLDVPLNASGDPKAAVEAYWFEGSFTVEQRALLEAELAARGLGGGRVTAFAASAGLWPVPGWALDELGLKRREVLAVK